MKKRRLTFIVVLLMMALSSGAFSDILLLPGGTTIGIPGKDSIFLSQSHFLLERSDMEKATIAMETVPIREKEVSDLTALNQSLQKDLDSWKLWGTAGLIGGPILTALLIEVIHAAIGK